LEIQPILAGKKKKQTWFFWYPNLFIPYLYSLLQCN
jgi:hypothetical protein